MTGRTSQAVAQAVSLALGGATIKAACEAAGCHRSSVRYALRKMGHPPREKYFKLCKGKP